MYACTGASAGIHFGHRAMGNRGLPALQLHTQPCCVNVPGLLLPTMTTGQPVGCPQNNAFTSPHIPHTSPHPTPHLTHPAPTCWSSIRTPASPAAA